MFVIRKDYLQRAWVRYAWAVLVTALAAMLRWALPGALEGTPYLAFYPAVVLSALLGGFGPGLLATVGSAVCVDMLFDSTLGWIDLRSPVVLGRHAIFLAGGFGISFLAQMQREAQARVSRQARELDELLAVLDLASVFVRDLDDRITRWSTGCQRLYGFAPEHALGKVSHDLLQTRFPESLEKIRATLMTTGRWEGELQHTRADGCEVAVASEWVLWRNAEGIPAAILEANSEVTDRKRAEDALRQTAEELKRSNQDLEQFAYVASHDLQEPLRAVSGFVTLLQQRYRGTLDEKADAWISHAVDGAARMQLLIGDLLAYSRVGTTGGALRSTNSQDSLDAALRNLAASIQDAGAVVTADPLPVVRADAIQLAQLFQNLIGNALKFRSDRPPEVHVGARLEQEDWLFWVQDNGIGIAPEYAERIFMIFQRLHTRRKYSGTGIGLAVCKKIVERHGGRIWVQSQPNEGATFYFTLSGRGEPR